MVVPNLAFKNMYKEKTKKTKKCIPCVVSVTSCFLTFVLLIELFSLVLQRSNSSKVYFLSISVSLVLTIFLSRKALNFIYTSYISSIDLTIGLKILLLIQIITILTKKTNFPFSPVDMWSGINYQKNTDILERNVLALDGKPISLIREATIFRKYKGIDNLTVRSLNRMRPSKLIESNKIIYYFKSKGMVGTFTEKKIRVPLVEGFLF